MDLNILIEKYINYKDIINQVENGDWKNNEKVANMSIKQIMNLRYVINELEKLGIHKIKPQRVD